MGLDLDLFDEVVGIGMGILVDVVVNNSLLEGV